MCVSMGFLREGIEKYAPIWVHRDWCPTFLFLFTVQVDLNDMWDDLNRDLVVAILFGSFGCFVSFSLYIPLRLVVMG